MKRLLIVVTIVVLVLWLGGLTAAFARHVSTENTEKIMDVQFNDGVLTFEQGATTFQASVLEFESTMTDFAGSVAVNILAQREENERLWAALDKVRSQCGFTPGKIQ